MKKHKLHLGLVLPGEPDVCEACIERLVRDLGVRPGIVGAHVDRSRAGAPRLCLHYDPTVAGLEEIQKVVESVGAELKVKYEHLSVPIGGLRHERQARLVEGVFAKQPGVFHVAVSYGARRLHAEFDPGVTTRAALLAVAAKAGVATWEEPAIPAQAAREQEEHEHEHGGPFGERSELVFSVTCGVLTCVGWALSRTGVPSLVPTVLFVAAYLLGSWFTLREVVVALRARRFEIDFLMLVAGVGAALLGEWFEGALLLFLFTLGHALEGFAMGRARKAIAALSKLVPETALRLADGGGEDEIPVAKLRIGDRILVKPNSRIPADAFVLAGVSSVNQAPITGESVPADKRPVPDAAVVGSKPESLAPEHRVFAGTINGAAALTVVVTRTAGESTLARVVKMVAEAETQKSPTQQFTDRFERIFVPIILAIVGLLLLAWVVVDEPFAKSFYRAMVRLKRRARSWYVIAKRVCISRRNQPCSIALSASPARKIRSNIMASGSGNSHSTAMTVLPPRRRSARTRL